MPVNVVHGPEDEKHWTEAKAAAAKQGQAKNYRLIMHIFQNMKKAAACPPATMAKADGDRSGEGSRGGHVIGHTKSGKAIYAASAELAEVPTFKVPKAQEAHIAQHSDFSAEDHRDAAAAHTQREDSLWAKRKDSTSAVEMGRNKKARVAAGMAAQAHTHAARAAGKTEAAPSARAERDKMARELAGYSGATRGSPEYQRQTAAIIALNAFDAAHPELMAEMRAEHHAAARAKAPADKTEKSMNKTMTTKEGKELHFKDLKAKIAQGGGAANPGAVAAKVYRQAGGEPST
ncbi:MAG: hypothetical protein ACRD3I_05200, partial [Terriglobales bacterium]